MVRRAQLLRLDGFIHALSGPGHVPGMSRPTMVALRTTSGKIEDVDAVLKVANPQCRKDGRGPLFLVRELVCNRLLAKLSVAVPEPYIVEVHPLLIDRIAARDPDTAEELKRHPGPHFATRLMEGYSDVQPHQVITGGGFTPQLAAIFAADSLILNADRGVGKPNLLWNAHGFVAIDHGLAFEFLRRGQGPFLPPDILSSHIAAGHLKRRGADFGEIFVRWVKEVSTEIIQGIHAQAPAEWNSHPVDVAQMIAHLCAHDSRLDTAARHLRMVVPPPTKT